MLQASKFNRVVARYLDGRCVRGHTVDFHPMRDTFHVCATETGIGDAGVLVRVAELKAIFFVKSLATTSHTGSGKLQDMVCEPSMRRVIVKFKDGEILLGATCGYSPERKGFFMQPLDPTTNNERIYVVQASVAFVRTLGNTESMSSVLTEMGADLDAPLSRLRAK